MIITCKDITSIANAKKVAKAFGLTIKGSGGRYSIEIPRYNQKSYDKDGNFISWIDDNMISHTGRGEYSVLGVPCGELVAHTTQEVLDLMANVVSGGGVVV